MLLKLQSIYQSTGPARNIIEAANLTSEDESDIQEHSRKFFDIGCVQQRKQLSKRFALIGLYF